jgi:O-antigen ligase
MRLEIQTLPPGTRWILTLIALAGLLMLLSLVPLPYALWQHLPGRKVFVYGYDALGIATPTLPMTLNVEGTISALLALCPPLVMFLLILRAPAAGRFAAVIALGGLAIVSILFGVAQQVSGYGSDLYIYTVTSRGGAVGFFANRNHLATLCLATMPFVAALAVPSRDENLGAGRPLLMAALLAFLVLGALVVQSLAGWLLLVPTLAGCWLVYRRGSGVRPGAIAVVGGGLALLLLATLFLPIAPNEVGQLAGEVTQQDRRAIMGTTWHAARSVMPIGSGFGSFVEYYPAFEDRTLTDTRYINHAHNDYLELLLEGGIASAILVAGFLFWWLRASRDAWQRRDRAAGTMRAASVAVGVILAHSLVDYPLRTTAIAAVAALAIGLLIVAEPLQPGRRRYGLSSGGQPGDRVISLSRRPSAAKAMQSPSLQP